MITYTIKQRPKIPRNKYGYLTTTSTGGGGGTTINISNSGSGGTVEGNYLPATKNGDTYVVSELTRFNNEVSVIDTNVNVTNGDITVEDGTITSNGLVADNYLFVNGDSIKAENLPYIGTATGTVLYPIMSRADGKFYHTPLEVYYKDNTMYFGTSTSNAVDVDIYGDLFVGGTTTYADVDMDNLNISSKLTAIRGEINNIVSSGTNELNGDITLNGYLAQGTTERDDINIYGTPSVWHYTNNGEWKDYKALDESSFTTSIDDVPENKIPTAQAIKNYVRDTAVTPIDVTALATKNGTMETSVMELISHPLYLYDNVNSCYAFARIVPYMGDAYVYLVWDVYYNDSGNYGYMYTYRVLLTAPNSGAVPIQTIGTVVAYKILRKATSRETWTLIN